MKGHTQGFTLIEMLVAMGILAVVTTVLLGGMLSTVSLNSKSEQTTQAAVAAQRTIDGIRATDPASLPSTGSSAPKTITIGGQTYTVTLTYCNPADYCTVNARRIRADVTLNNKVIFTAENVLTSVGSGVVSSGVTP